MAPQAPQLSFTDNNTYTGGTTVTGGIFNLANGAAVAPRPSATVGNPLSGGVVVKGGILTSGGGSRSSRVFPTARSSPVGSIAGALTVNSGGTVSPGGFRQRSYRNP